MLYQQIFNTKVYFDYTMGQDEVLTIVQSILAKDEDVREIILHIDENDSEYVMADVIYGKPAKSIIFKRSGYYGY